jgi:chromosome segregation and condensation protein ScpB
MDFDLVLLASFVRRSRQTVEDIAHSLGQAGIRTSPGKVALALLDLQCRLKDSQQYPFTLIETGLVWELEGKDEATRLLITGRAVQVPEPIDALDMDVLAVITISGRGISANRIESYLARDPNRSLEKLARMHLIYSIPRPVGKVWLPAEGMLRRFGFSSAEEIPGYKEYQAFLEGRRTAKEALQATSGNKSARQLKPRRSRAYKKKKELPA